MPIPIAAMIVGAGVGMAASPIGSLINTLVGPQLEPWKRANVYNANRRQPNIQLTFEQLCHAYYSGYCIYDDLQRESKSQGVDLVGSFRNDALSDWWSKYVELGQPNLPIDLLLRRNALGKISDSETEKRISRYGFAVNDDYKQILADGNPLDLESILALWWRRDIDETVRDKYLRHAGWRDDDIRKLLPLIRNGPSGIELLLMLNRGIIDVPKARSYMRWTGMVDSAEQELTLALRFQYPSPTEIGLMATRHVFNEAYSTKWHLDDDAPDKYNLLVKQMGFNWTPSDAGPQEPAAGDTTIQKLMWRAHWRTLDPMSAAQMLFRLRDSGGIGGGQRVPGIPVFTSADFQDVLTSNEIIPGFRQQIEAIARPIPQRLIVKRLYSAGIINRAEVKETIKDQGYADDRAEQLTKLVVHETEQAKVNKLRPITHSQIKEAYRIGTLSKTEAAAALYLLYLDNYESQQAYLAMSAGDRGALAAENQFVQLTLAGIDVDVNGELVAKGIEVVRKAYLRAELTALQAQDSLLQLGINIGRAANYVQLWSYELAAEGAEATAAKLVSWYQDHLIDASTLQARLLRLHYSPFDVSLMMASANLKLALAQQKIEAASAKLQAQQAKAAANAIKALKKQEAELAKLACKSGSKTQLAAWAYKGLVTYPEAYARLTECGLTSEDAISLLAASAKLTGDSGRETIKEKAGLTTKAGANTVSNPSAGSVASAKP